MNQHETGLLLAAIAGYDQRTVGETDVIAWHGILGDLTIVECTAAVQKHYADSTDRLMPAHIRRIVIAARNDRAMRNGLPAVPDDAVPKPDWFDSTVAHYRERAKAEAAAAVARGEEPTYGDAIIRPHDRTPRGMQ